MVSELPQSLLDNPFLDQWVRFTNEDCVLIGTGKVELGQGVLTALRQIAAEELEVTPESIRMVSGLTGVSPEEGFTAGSRSIELSGGSIRIVCAEVRQIAIAQAAQRLGCGPDEIAVINGRFLKGGGAASCSYWSMADALDLHRPATGSAPFRAMGQWRHIGRSEARLDLPGILAGGSFIHDMRPEGMLHGRVLRCPQPGARLLSLDEAVLRRRIGPDVEVIRLQSFVAVVSENEAAADRAHQAVGRAAEWQKLGASLEEHANPYYLRDLPASDRVVTFPAATAPADIAGSVLSATYTRPYVAHGSIGTSCALAHWDGNALKVWSHTQGVGPLRNSIARALQLPAACVTVQHHPGSGCYGHNGADDAALDAALIAMQCQGRTIRVLWTREEELAFSPVGSASVVTLSATQADDGRIATWNMEIWSATHGQRPGANGSVNLLADRALRDDEKQGDADDVPDGAGGGGNRNSIALYDLPEQRILHHMVLRAPLRTSSLRGLGAQANVFAIESFVDELADAAGRDPVEYRLSMMSDPRARRVIEEAVAMSPWRARGPGAEGVGFGFAFSRYKNKAAYLAAVAEVEIDEVVRVRRLWCAADAGLVINPDGAINQIEGGAIQSASWTLKEQVLTDQDGISTRDWESYPILRFSEVPEVVVRLVGSREDMPPLGIGEVALGPVTAAIANAVAHGLGVRIRDLPLSRDRLMTALMEGAAA